MPFPNHIREEALIKSQRHCCVCHEFAGRAINVHHIKQEADGGENTIGNAIVLCLRCHSEAGHFNPRHPIGTSYSPQELIRHRDQWWESCEKGTALFGSSVIPKIKRVLTSAELHKYKLLVRVVNGNEHVMSSWKLDIFVPCDITVETLDIDQHVDVEIDKVRYQKYQVIGSEKIHLGEEREILDLDWATLEYHIDDHIYNMSRNKEIKILWVFYSDIDPPKKGIIEWGELQEF